jgi:hypothetical protein
MRKVGFSTGALAKGDFARAIGMLQQAGVSLIELSALRQNELQPLVEALPDLNLSSFSYVSVHAPSRIDGGTEKSVLALLDIFVQRGLPIIIHPDAIQDFSAWRSIGSLLLVENMDLRKRTGRTAAELSEIFSKLPDAALCLDLGHARQVDSTMSEATLILGKFGSRLKQLHISEVNTMSHHESLSLSAIRAFNKVSHLIPDDCPLILETPVRPEEIQKEVDHARHALTLNASLPAGVA